jgi:hypothetical protein
VFPGALAPLSTNSGVRSLTGCDIGCGRVGVYEDDRVGVRGLRNARCLLTEMTMEAS